MRIQPKVLLLVLTLIAALGFFYVRGKYYYPVVNRDAAGDTIVALGDSLTYGTGAARGEDWPSLVGEKADRIIVNKGVPGDTTSDALARLDRDVLALKPAVVFVGLGGNDILNRLPEAELFGNLRKIIGKIQGAGSMVILLGLNGFPLDRGLGGQYAALARETGCVYVPDVLGGILTNIKLKSDQIHPNAAGYQIMADKIYGVADKYL